MKTNIVKALLPVGLSFFVCCKKTQSNNEVTKNEEPKKEETTASEVVFKKEKTLPTHLAKTQYYRWYQLYERPMNPQRVSNQMELLSENITIETSAGTMTGKENYPKRLDVYKGWKNAHQVQQVSYQNTESNGPQLIAKINYNNIQPDGKKANYALDYTIDLIEKEGELPLFSSVKITPTSPIEANFKDSYHTNRALSLMHYWMVNMERLDGNVTPFEELLTDDFELNFSSESKISSIEQFKTWLNGTPLQLKSSNHHPENFEIEVIDENNYKVSVAFDWYGIAKNDQKMKVKTLHKWLVTDNPNERFSRIKKIDVRRLEPFTMVP